MFRKDQMWEALTGDIYSWLLFFLVRLHLTSYCTLANVIADVLPDSGGRRCESHGKVRANSH